jgi:hypothetical protein
LAAEGKIKPIATTQLDGLTPETTFQRAASAIAARQKSFIYRRQQRKRRFEESSNAVLAN